MKSPHVSIFLILFSVLAVLSDVDAQNLVKDKPYKFGDFLIVSSDTMKVDFIVKSTPVKKKISAGDTLYEDNKYLILGNSDVISPYYIYGIFKKFTLPYSFSMYEVSVYKGKLAPPNFKTDTAAFLFRTQIRDQCKSNGINFAGHYTLCKWGCGSECVEIAIVDRISGKINYSNINLGKYGWFYTLAYKKNSSLVITNDWMMKVYKGYILCNSDKWKLGITQWGNKGFRELY